MKRSHSIDLETENKQVKLEESLDSNSCENTFIPSNIEKQIVSKTFAAICRSNMSDWIVDENDDCYSKMIICEIGGVIENDTNISCGVNIEVFCREDCTVCDILYNLETGQSGTLYLYWNNYSDQLTVSKIISKRCYFVFSYDIIEKFYICPTDCIEDSWCYFKDARRHLDRIAL